MKIFLKLVGELDDMYKTDACCELALEALYRQETLHASSTRGWVLGASGLTLCLFPPSGERSFVCFIGNKKVCY